MKITLRAWILFVVSAGIVAFSSVTIWKTRDEPFTKGQDITLYPQMVELETARDEESLLDLLRHEQPTVEGLQRAQYRKGLGLDNIFLFLYPLQLLCLIAFAWRAEGRPVTRIFLTLSAVTILAGGFCDWEENRHIGRLLSCPLLQPVMDATRRWSIAKWTLIGIAYFATAAALHAYIKSPPVRTRPELPPMGPWRLRIITVALFATSVFSIGGAISFLWQGDFRRLLVASVYSAAVAMLACATLPPLRIRARPVAAYIVLMRM